METNYAARNDHEIGRYLQYAREEKELSRRQLCQLIGYTSLNAAVNLYHWERGDCGIPKRYIRRLSMVLGIPCSLLLP